MLVSVAKCRTEQTFYLAVIPAPAQDHAYPEFVLPEQARWPSVRHGCPLYLGQRCILGWCVCAGHYYICTGQCKSVLASSVYTTLHTGYRSTLQASKGQCGQAMQCRPEQPLTTNSSSWSCIAYLSLSTTIWRVSICACLFFCIWHFLCFLLFFVTFCFPT